MIFFFKYNKQVFYYCKRHASTILIDAWYVMRVDKKNYALEVNWVNVATAYFMIKISNKLNNLLVILNYNFIY